MFEKTLDEYIGSRVRISQEEHRRRSETMYPTWLSEGQKFKATREHSAISQAEVSKNIGADESVIRRFENGLYVKRRPVIKASYKLALEIISRRRLNIVEALTTNNNTTRLTHSAQITSCGNF